MFLLGSFYFCFVVIIAKPEEPNCQSQDDNGKVQVLELKHEITDFKLKEIQQDFGEIRREMNLKNQLTDMDSKLLTLVAEALLRQDKRLKALENVQDQLVDLVVEQNYDIGQKKDLLKTTPVLFKAKDANLPTESTTSSKDAIVFPTNVMNVGEAYNNKTGVFTAPVKGVYMFTVQLCIEAEKDLSINIVAEGKVISASFFRQEDMDGVCHTSDGIAVLELWDDVTVRVKSKSAGAVIYKDRSRNNAWSSFSGVLLHK